MRSIKAEIIFKTARSGGKGGQNVRLASKLSGWGIDVVLDEADKKEKKDREDEKVDETKTEDNEIKTEDVKTEKAKVEKTKKVKK